MTFYYFEGLHIVFSKSITVLLRWILRNRFIYFLVEITYIVISPSSNVPAFITSCYYVIFDRQENKLWQFFHKISVVYLHAIIGHICYRAKFLLIVKAGGSVYVIRNQKSTIFTFYGANRKLINVFPGKLTSLDQLRKTYSWTLQHQIRLVNIGHEFRPFRSKSEVKPLKGHSTQNESGV